MSGSLERLIQKVFSERLSSDWILYQKVYSSMYRYLVDMPITMRILVESAGEDETYNVMKKHLTDFHCDTYGEMKQTMIDVFEELSQNLLKMYHNNWENRDSLDYKQQVLIDDWVRYLIQKSRTESSKVKSILLDSLSMLAIAIPDRFVSILSEVGFETTWDMLYEKLRPFLNEVDIYEEYMLDQGIEGYYWDDVVLRYYLENNLDQIYFEKTFGSYFD